MLPNALQRAVVLSERHSDSRKNIKYAKQVFLVIKNKMDVGHELYKHKTND